MYASNFKLHIWLETVLDFFSVFTFQEANGENE